MDFALTQDQISLKNDIINFARKELNDNIIERDKEGEFSRELWLKCANMGILGLPIDEKFGGLGLDAVSTAIALEAFGYGCEDSGLVFSICAHLLACTIPIWKFGNDKQKQKYLPKLIDGSLIAVNGMTEPSSGSDAFNMSTKAARTEHGYKINGTKTFSSNGPVADLAVLYALTDSSKGYYGGVSVFLLESNTKGYNPGQKFDKMGLRTSPIGELVLEDVEVTDNALLGGLGAGPVIFNYSMDWERICIAATHVGKIQRLLEIAISYSKTRKAAGQKISNYQAISHKIADIKIRLEAARFLVYHAAWMLDQKKNVTMHASITKVFVSESLLKIASDVLQILGGYGFMTEYEVERAVRDSYGSTIYSGTNEVQRNIIARWLGL
ncbi:MAG: acyl-CoA dehydrogenase family protein [Ignavibacteriaceae bacterium]